MHAQGGALMVSRARVFATACHATHYLLHILLNCSTKLFDIWVSGLDPTSVPYFGRMIPGPDLDSVNVLLMWTQSSIET